MDADEFKKVTPDYSMRNRCETCHQIIRGTVPVILSSTHARSLLKLAMATTPGDVVHRNDLDLTNNQASVLTRAKLWNLIYSPYHHSGLWGITDVGWAFIAGKRTIPRIAITWEKLIKYQGEQVTFAECLVEPAWDYEQVLGNRIPVEVFQRHDCIQHEMFPANFMEAEQDGST